MERPQEDVPGNVKHIEVMSDSGSGLFKSIMYPLFAVLAISLATLAYFLTVVKGSAQHASSSYATQIPVLGR